MLISLNGCSNNNKQAQTNSQTTSNSATQEKDKNATAETKVTQGELFDKVNAVVPVKEIKIIEDKEIGFKNLNISINVSNGTAVEELDSYTKEVVKIQRGLNDYFANNNYLNITYVMYVDNEMKSVLTNYKKQNNQYNLESTTIIDEKYKKAAQALN